MPKFTSNFDTPWTSQNSTIQCPVCKTPCTVEIHYFFKTPRSLHCPKCGWAPQEDLPSIIRPKHKRKQYEEHR